KRAYCLKTQPATGETYPKSDLFNKAAAECKYSPIIRRFRRCPIISGYLYRMLTADGKDSGR
ncbi:hypothetical protein, partial [Klebsiella pneumoniae]|uniref:hypothetical protein n=1 Tax=Klebsiella pneumoniae TaxID=573 RepID=UPI00211B9A86